MSEAITRVSLGEAIDVDRTDWSRIRALTDDQLEAAIASDDDTFAADTPPAGTARYEVYRDGGGQWRWRMTGDKGAILARSAGSFTSERKALQAIEAMRAALSKAA